MLGFFILYNAFKNYIGLGPKQMLPDPYSLEISKIPSTRGGCSSIKFSEPKKRKTLKKSALRALNKGLSSSPEMEGRDQVL